MAGDTPYPATSVGSLQPGAISPGPVTGAYHVRAPGDGTRAVAVGGGHGLSRTLQALTAVVDHTTAVITAADDGGSSGRLRRDLGVVPPGDLRMALAAMARNRGLAELIQYRFAEGELAGHSLGNLVLVALAHLRGDDLVAALDDVAGLLDVPGRVLPCTTTPVHLHATSAAGRIDGQVAVARTPRVERVWLEPEAPPATGAAVRAIGRADLIVLGPGSLFTSLLPNLLVPGIADAIRSAPAPVVFVANIREQPGETEGMTLAEHTRTLLDHVPGLHLSAIIGHDGPRPRGAGAPLPCVQEELGAFADQVVCADLLDGVDGHDPAALATVLGEVLGGPRAALR